MPENYRVGQAWTYEAPKGFESSRIIIGAILTFASHEPVICSAVTGAPMLDDMGKVQPLTIPFLPFSKSAFDQTVILPDGEGEIPTSFGDSYESWKTDAKGLGFINIPFKGLLRDMVDGLEEKSRKDRHVNYMKDH
jgi:hypothetical protein